MIHDWPFGNQQADVRYWGWWLKPPRTDLYPYRAVIHSAWQAPDGDVAGFFVNITNKPLPAEVEVPAVSGLKAVQLVEYVSGKKQTLAEKAPLPAKVKVDLPPSAFVILEAHGL
jgi:hypothetical protein